jgi:tRNA (guanine-N7-)-methyltransferase
MGKAKMFKIRSIDLFANVFQNGHYTRPVLKNSSGEELDLKGKWRSDIFKNDRPVVVELACGKGEYSIALAQLYPDKNFIGIDSKGARIYNGAKTATENNLHNLVFVRMRIENIAQFFAAGEIDEIWITFPDPFPKKADAKRRLTAPVFLARYVHISKPGATVHFKTDDLALFNFTKASADEMGFETIYYKEDIYASPLHFAELEVKTYYERLHLEKGRTINYLAFRL